MFPTFVLPSTIKSNTISNSTESCNFDTGCCQKGPYGRKEVVIVITGDQNIGDKREQSKEVSCPSSGKVSANDDI
jgi:hypothetical protein